MEAAAAAFDAAHEGWELRHDESSGQAYYVNLVTGESSWEAPVLSTLPDDGTGASARRLWTEATDENGRVYYMNLETMETSWDPPPGFYGVADPVTTASVSECRARRPSTAEQMDQLNALLSGGDDEDADGDGEHSLVEGRADSVVDEVAAAGAETETDGSEWMMFLNETDGVPYYYNHITGECLWEPPAAFLEYHQQHSGAHADGAGLAGQPEQHGDHAQETDTSQGKPPAAPPTPTLTPTIEITPEFEEKVRRAVESVSKTPVGSSRLLFVRTPTVRSLDTGRSASRPTSSSGASARQQLGTARAAPVEASAGAVAANGSGLLAPTGLQEDAALERTREEHGSATAVDEEEEKELQRRDEMMRQIMFEEMALVIQCLIRCFLARRRVNHTRKERAATQISSTADIVGQDDGASGGGEALADTTAMPLVEGTGDLGDVALPVVGGEAQDEALVNGVDKVGEHVEEAEQDDGIDLSVSSVIVEENHVKDGEEEQFSHDRPDQCTEDEDVCGADRDGLDALRQQDTADEIPVQGEELVACNSDPVGGEEAAPIPVVEPVEVPSTPQTAEKISQEGESRKHDEIPPAGIDAFEDKLVADTGGAHGDEEIEEISASAHRESIADGAVPVEAEPLPRDASLSRYIINSPRDDDTDSAARAGSPSMDEVPQANVSIRDHDLRDDGDPEPVLSSGASDERVVDSITAGSADSTPRSPRPEKECDGIPADNGAAEGDEVDAPISSLQSQADEEAARTDDSSETVGEGHHEPTQEQPPVHEIRVESAALSARRSARQARSGRRADERASTSARPRPSTFDVTTSERLAILSVSTFLPARPARIPRDEASQPSVRQPTASAAVVGGIVRKPLTRRTVIVDNGSTTREQNEEERQARLATMEKARVEKALLWEAEVATCRRVFADATVRHAVQTQQMRKAAAVVRERAVEEAREIRQREHAAVAARTANTDPSSSLIDGSITDVAASTEEIKTRLSAMADPEGFVETMMHERLRSIKLMVHRMERGGGSTKVLLEHWRQREQSFPSSMSDASADPYWSTLVDKLRRVAASSSDLPQQLTSHRTESFDSLLHGAAWKGRVDVVELLVSEFHADVNAVDCSATKTTPLHEACRGGRTAVVACLLSHGSLLDAVDGHGETALHTASRLGSTQVVELLVAAGEAQEDSDSMSSLSADPADASSLHAEVPRPRVLGSLSWSQCFHLRNLKHRRAVDVASLPSLVEFLSQYGAQLGNHERAAGRSLAGSLSRGSSASSSSTAKRIKDRKKPKTSRPKSASKASAASMDSAPCSTTVAVHAR